jgi:hypothetical protein
VLQERVARVTERVVAAARLSKWLARIALVLAIGVLALQPLIANAAQPQPPVDLGTAASFAVLAGQYGPCRRGGSPWQRDPGLPQGMNRRRRSPQSRRLCSPAPEGNRTTSSSAPR